MIKRLVRKDETGENSNIYFLNRYREVYGSKKLLELVEELDKYMKDNKEEVVSYIISTSNPYVIVELENGDFIKTFCPKLNSEGCPYISEAKTCTQCWLEAVHNGIMRSIEPQKHCGHKIVILTGVDRCGKSSIWLEINKQTKYKHFIIDRFTEGFLTYKEIYNKGDELCNPEELRLFEENMRNVPHILVYLDCDPKEIRERCIKTNEPLYDVERHQAIYKKYFNQSSLNKVILNTTGKTPEESVKELVDNGLI